MVSEKQVRWKWLLAALMVASCSTGTRAGEGGNVGTAVKTACYRDEDIARAMAAVKAMMPTAEADVTRPVYHFRSRAQWLSAALAPIWYKGYYHLFYELNPYSLGWDNIYWGHARSKDLVYWEYLPIAIWPSRDLGESHNASGFAVINEAGERMIFYSSYKSKYPMGVHSDQWLAYGDEDMMVWTKHPANPIMPESLNGDLVIYDWRDPDVFVHEGRTYCITGGNLNEAKGGQAVAPLYRAKNGKLTEWDFLGIAFKHPGSDVSNMACVRLFKLGEKWVLVALLSPHGKTEYFVGTFDAESGKFVSETGDMVDYGGNYSAPHCLKMSDGRRIMWGWVVGSGGQGWAGCVTLPRELSLTDDGVLLQNPAGELKKLRHAHEHLSGIELQDNSQVIEKAKGETLEIVAEFAAGDAGWLDSGSFGLKVRRSADGSKGIVISYDGEELDVGGAKAPLKAEPGERSLKLHVFLDRSVMEVYVNDGRKCFTKVIHADPKDVGLEVFADDGKITLRNLDIWQIKSIW